MWYRSSCPGYVHRPSATPESVPSLPWVLKTKPSLKNFISFKDFTYFDFKNNNKTQLWLDPSRCVIIVSKSPPTGIFSKSKWSSADDDHCWQNILPNFWRRSSISCTSWHRILYLISSRHFNPIICKFVNESSFFGSSSVWYPFSYNFRTVVGPIPQTSQNKVIVHIFSSFSKCSSLDNFPVVTISWIRSCNEFPTKGRPLTWSTLSILNKNFSITEIAL